MPDPTYAWCLRSPEGVLQMEYVRALESRVQMAVQEWCARAGRMSWDSMQRRSWRIVRVRIEEDEPAPARSPGLG